MLATTRKLYSKIMLCSMVFYPLIISKVIFEAKNYNESVLYLEKTMKNLNYNGNIYFIDHIGYVYFI